MMKTLLRLTLFIVTLGLGLFFISHYLVVLGSTHVLSQTLAEYHCVFTAWRYTLYALVIILWPYFIGLIGESQHWPKETILYLSGQRLKLFALFAIIEVFFVYNFIGHLFLWL